MTRAKFRCNSITRTQSYKYENGQQIPQEVNTIRLTPVCDGTAENKAFYASTPSGSIELATINLEAAAQFELNGEYYVDFTPAPKG